MTRTRKITHALALGLALVWVPSTPFTTISRAHAQEGESSEGGATETETPAAAEPEPSSEETKPKLSDRIKSVQRKVFLKKQRVEIFPQFGLDLNDPFFQHLIIGAAVGFHLADSFSVEARGGLVFASIKQGAIRFVRVETDSLLNDPPELKYHADLDFLWAPFYGKISLFGEGILHFDTYLTAGPGIFGTDAGLNPSVNIGLGQRYFLNDFLVARVELRNYVFIDNRDSASDIQNLMILSFALSGFFPMAFEHEFQ